MCGACWRYVSKTEYCTEREVGVPSVPDVQGSQTRLEKGVNVVGIVDHGQTGHIGHDSGDDDYGARP